MSDDNKEGAGVPVAWRYRIRGGAWEYQEIPFFKEGAPGPREEHQALYATPPAVMPAAPSDADEVLRLRAVLGNLYQKITDAAYGREGHIPSPHHLDALIAQRDRLQTMQPQAEPTPDLETVLGKQVWFDRKDVKRVVAAIFTGYGIPKGPFDMRMKRLQAEPAAGEQAGAEMAEDDPYYNLLGVIADAKAGQFNAVCLETLERIASQLAAPGAAIAAREQEPVISVEDSLRTRLRWSQEKVEQLEQENRELRGRLPGPSFDDLMAAEKPASREEVPAAPQVETLTDEQITAIHSMPYVRACLLEYVQRPRDEEASAIVKAIAAQVGFLTQPATVQQAEGAETINALDFRCPWCGSQPGVACVTLNKGVHIERREIALKGMQPGERKEGA